MWHMSARVGLTRLALATCVSCGGNVASGGGRDASSPDACNLGCARQPGVVSLVVVDGFGNPVTSPSFAELGAPLTVSCFGLSDGGSPSALDAGDSGAAIAGCTGWHLSASSGPLSFGSHSIVVTADGFASQTITLDVPFGVGCACEGPAVSQRVTLSALHSDDAAVE